MTTALPDAVHQIEAALDQLAAALVTGRADAVLAAEEPLALAIAGLAVSPRSADDRDDLRTAIDRTRRSLARCRALGDAASAFAADVFPATAYARDGGRPAEAASVGTPHRA